MNFQMTRKLKNRFVKCMPVVICWFAGFIYVVTMSRSYFFIHFYCSHLWWKYTKDTMRKMAVAFNNSFRKFIGYDKRCSASGMLTFNNTLSFNSLRHKSIFGFKNRLDSCCNIIISLMYNHSLPTCSLSVTEWTSSLFVKRYSLLWSFINLLLLFFFYPLIVVLFLFLLYTIVCSVILYVY